jgi:hypothetical protein
MSVGPLPMATTDPTMAPAVPSTAPVDQTAPAKKQPAALPLAPSAGGSVAPPTQTPAQTAIAGATQNTTDPLAFAPNGGGTPAGSLSPDAAAPTAAPDPEGIAYQGMAQPGTFNSYDDAGNAVTRTGDGPWTPQLSPTDPSYQNFVKQTNINAGQSLPFNHDPQGVNGAGPGMGPVGGVPTSPAEMATHQWQAPTGAAPDTNPSVLPSNIAQAVQQPASGGSGGPAVSSGGAAAPISATGPNAGVGLTPTDPGNPLTMQTITPNNNVDRVKLAQQSLQSTIDNVLNPRFAADQRATNELSFGAGRGVSGMNRTAQGNVESDYERTKANLANEVLNPAITGSIDDLYKNIGISQQQQGFQADQQRTAFQQAAQAQGLSDSETAQAFQQALQMFFAGQIDDPTQFLEYLSGQYALPVGGTK